MTRKSDEPKLIDRLAEAGREIRRLNDRSDKVDVIQFGAKDDRIKRNANEEQSHLASCVDALRDYVTTIEATTLEGAIVQLREVYLLFDIMQSSALTDFDKAESDRKIRRLIYSIEGALRGMVTGENNLEGIPVLQANLNPWLSYEQRIEAGEIRRQELRELGVA